MPEIPFTVVVLPPQQAMIIHACHRVVSTTHGVNVYLWACLIGTNPYHSTLLSSPYRVPVSVSRLRRYLVHVSLLRGYTFGRS